mmetsp:Transcript_23473/g.34792  ORF Transcript_23473/g.34792 Transcript_23473/m.34792 type:complete len:175 (+) Transcript_23473:134-658(+)
MANAAAKKAALAKINATATYFPVLVSLNILHLLLTYMRGSFTTYRTLVTIVQWIFTYISYQGIVSDAKQNSAIYSSPTTMNGAKIAGGPWLDLLFVVVLSQYGALYIHEGFMDAMLLVLPGGYTFYTQVVKKANAIKNEEMDGNGNGGKQDDETKKMIEERRKKRAERRRQKRG